MAIVNREPQPKGVRWQRPGGWLAALVVGVVFVVCVGVWLYSRTGRQQESPAVEVAVPDPVVRKPRKKQRARGASERGPSVPQEHRGQRAEVSREEAHDGGDETGDEVELLQSQLRLLELPWEKVLEAVEEDMTMLVGLCVEQSESSEPVPEGVALDFIVEPKGNEAKITEVRYREESHSRSVELLDCIEGLAQIGPVPREVADRFEDGVFTLRLGRNRPPDVAK
ncbi:MAG: hypothetical protein ACRBN8_30460 [Nannocystales bacterium]